MKGKGFAASLGRISIAMVLVLLLLLNAAMAFGGTRQEENSDYLWGYYGDILNVGMMEEPTNLNPLSVQSDDDASLQVIDIIYDSLARPDKTTLELKPWIANEWEVSNDGLYINVTINTNVTWQDGDSLTIEDIIYTFEQYGIDTAAGARFPYIASVTKVSDFVVSFKLNTENARFFKDVLGAKLVKTGFTNTTTTPNGCGPFEFKEQVDGTSLELESYSGYFMGRPYIDGIKYTYFDTIGEASMAGINGTIEFIAAPIEGYLHSVGYPYLDAEGNTTELSLSDAQWTKKDSPGMSYYYLGFNNDATKPSSDLALRQAISYTVDKKTHASANNGITAKPTVIKANKYWYNASVTEYVKYDVEGKLDLSEATNILDANGYVDNNTDGWRDLPTTGNPSFTLKMLRPVSSEEPERAAIWSALKGQFEKLGLKVTDESLSVDDRLTKIITANDWDIFLMEQRVDADPSYMYDLFHSSGSGNMINYNNANYDALIDSAQSETNITERVELIKEAQEYLAQDVPVVPIFYTKVTETFNETRFEGWVSMAGGVNNIWSFMSIHHEMEGELTVSMFTESLSMNSGKNKTISITVDDENGNDVEEAYVFMTVDGGTLTINGGENKTNSEGELTVVYTAPEVDAITTYTIEVEVMKPGYTKDSTSIQITVHPIVNALDVMVRIDPNVIDETNEDTGDDVAQVTVTVTSGGQAISGADVTLEVTPDNAGGNLSVYSGQTDSQGKLTVTFDGETRSDTVFKVTANAFKTGYQEGEGSASVQITGTDEPGHGTNWLMVGGITAGVAVIMILLLLILIRK